MSIAQNLKLARKTARLSQAELAEKSGVSLGAVQYAENPVHEPSVGTLRKLAKALDTPLLSLIGEDVSGEALRIGVRVDRLAPQDRSLVLGMVERFEGVAA